jgi:uncharacterized repeat protein (TIGR03803 family)
LTYFPVRRGTRARISQYHSPNVNAGGGWEYWTLYAFLGDTEGANPSGPIAIDKAGNIYGTTRSFGLSYTPPSDNGTVFELSPPPVSGDAWTETTLHEFGGSSSNDGSEPIFGLIFFKGKLYGTTAEGGTDNLGTVFSVAVN